MQRLRTLRKLNDRQQTILSAYNELESNIEDVLSLVNPQQQPGRAQVYVNLSL
jgi:hypothetical protein